MKENYTYYNCMVRKLSDGTLVVGIPELGVYQAHAPHWSRWPRPNLTRLAWAIEMWSCGPPPPPAAWEAYLDAHFEPGGYQVMEGDYWKDLMKEMIAKGLLTPPEDECP
jgi:hypothetical protein